MVFDDLFTMGIDLKFYNQIALNSIYNFSMPHNFVPIISIYIVFSSWMLNTLTIPMNIP